MSTCVGGGDGTWVGCDVGSDVGSSVGAKVGCSEGAGTGRELGAGAGTSVGLAVGLLVGTAVSSHLALYFENLEDLEENFVQWASAAVSKNLPLWKGSNEMCEKGEGASTLLMDQLQKRGGEFPTNQE